VVIKNQKGFTLLESLVALVIITTTFAFVWEWFGTAVITTDKVNDAVALPIIFKQFEHKLRLEDFENKREGEYQISGYSVRWNASIKRQSSQEAHRRQPQWRVVLLEIDAEVYKGRDLVNSFSTYHTSFWREQATAESIFGTQ
jgi:general secretion pathway protein J